MTRDVINPSAVSDLTALTTAGQTGSITLNWTAPGNDGTVGNISGGMFWIKYSTQQITVFSASGTTLVQASTSMVVGSKQGYVASNLLPMTTYYFAVLVRDAFGNWGTWSTVGANTLNFSTATHGAITVNGTAADWVGTANVSTNSAVISGGEWIWTNKWNDERTDSERRHEF